ncbi:MAG: polysaccharide deacetylase family protein [Alteromonadaceae bacterium]|nr:polysaccharide deacetylase family protein [Alteromonadaceae bacterium]
MQHKLLLFTLFILFCLPVKASTSATILVYHHVSTSTPPSTSISPEKLKEHLEYLAANHNVVSLPELVQSLQTGKSLPKKAVAITFDDGFKNILENGHPLLKQHQFPYTIFINPYDVGQGNKLNWEEMRRMTSEGVTFANHFWDHRHLLDKTAYANDESWLAETKKLILKAQNEIESNLGLSFRYLAYPFGEYDADIAELLKNLNFVGFAQHSGAVGQYTNWQAVPRFPAAGIYSNLRTLKVKMASLNMPVIENSQHQVAFSKAPTKIDYKLTLNTEDLRISQINCFYKGKNIEIERATDSIRINIAEKPPVGRSRVNCTVPSKSQNGCFYWHSQPMFVAKADGSYLD